MICWKTLSWQMAEAGLDLWLQGFRLSPTLPKIPALAQISLQLLPGVQGAAQRCGGHLVVVTQRQAGAGCEGRGRMCRLEPPEEMPSDCQHLQGHQQ